MIRGTPVSTRTDTRFPYTTLFRSRLSASPHRAAALDAAAPGPDAAALGAGGRRRHLHRLPGPAAGRTLALGAGPARSPVLAALCLARAAGRVLERRPSPRAVFDGMAREYPWDLLHLAYFCGYAGWNYLTTPFLFTYPGFETEEIEPWEEEGEIWRRLKVRFSPDIPTHCPEQI